ncbi:MAG TPA: hypothetical protein VIJ66_08650 [Solirubrobacteraceae bacterium]
MAEVELGVATAIDTDADPRYALSSSSAAAAPGLAIAMWPIAIGAYATKPMGAWP